MSLRIFELKDFRFQISDFRFQIFFDHVQGTLYIPLQVISLLRVRLL